MKKNRIFSVLMYSLLLMSTMFVMSFLTTVTHCDFTYEVVPCKMDTLQTADTIVIANQLPYYELSDVCFHNETFFEYAFLR